MPDTAPHPAHTPHRRRLLARSALIMALCLPVFACSRHDDSSHAHKTRTTVWDSQLRVLDQARAARDKANASEIAGQRHRDTLRQESRQ